MLVPSYQFHYELSEGKVQAWFLFASLQKDWVTIGVVFGLQVQVFKCYHLLFYNNLAFEFKSS